MPCGPGTYGRQRGRPKKRRGKKSMDVMYEMIGESIWDTYSDMAYILIEKSISQMVRRGEYGEEGDEPQNPQAKYKQERSLERAEATAERADRREARRKNLLDLSDEEEFLAQRGPPSKRAKRVLAKHPRAARRLRVPAPLEGDAEIHQIAAYLSKRAKKGRGR
jgi:hypothetical protein